MEYNHASDIVKDVSFGDNANKKIIAGVEKLSSAVKSTLGASGYLRRLPRQPGHNKRWSNRCGKRSLIRPG